MEGAHRLDEAAIRARVQVSRSGAGLPLPVGQSLCSGSVCLRVPAAEDLEFIRRMWADVETMEPVGGPVVLSPEEGVRWYRRWVDPGSADRAYWLVTCEGRPVGEISFRCFDPVARAGMLNVKIVAWERGRGHARQAVRAVLRYFFEDLGGTQMNDDVALSNGAGQSLMLSEGFTRDTTATGVCRLYLTRRQWEVRQSAR
jgi:RimJ/RimL family protein N-acetyltransferase